MISTLMKSNSLRVFILTVSIAMCLLQINPLLSLAMLCVISIFTLAYVSPNLWLKILIIYIPLESIIVSWLPVNIIDKARIIPELILGAIFFKLVLFKKNRIKLNIIDMFILFTIIWSIFSSLINSTSFLYIFIGARVLFRFLMVFYIVRRLNDDTVFFQKLYNMLLWLARIEVALGILQIFVKKLFGPMYITSFGDNYVMNNSIFGAQGTLLRYDQYGMFLAIVGIFVFVDYLKRGRMTRWLDLAFIFIGILLSTSRQSMIVLACGILILLFILNGKKFIESKLKSVFFLTITVVLSLMIMMLFLNKGLEDRRNPVSQITSIFQSDTYTVSMKGNFRLYYTVNIGSKLIHDKPLGFGLGTFGSSFSVGDENIRELYYKFGLVDDYFLHFIADVSWISILGQTGIVGTLLFILSQMFIILLSVGNIHRVNEEKKYILAASATLTICFIIAGFLGPNYEIRTNSFYLWLLNGLAISILLDLKNIPIAECSKMSLPKKLSKKQEKLGIV